MLFTRWSDGSLLCYISWNQTFCQTCKGPQLWACIYDARFIVIDGTFTGLCHSRAKHLEYYPIFIFHPSFVLNHNKPGRADTGLECRPRSVRALRWFLVSQNKAKYKVLNEWDKCFYDCIFSPWLQKKEENKKQFQWSYSIPKLLIYKSKSSRLNMM